MSCQCDAQHSEQFTCSGIGCDVCILGEKDFFQNPELPEERYCLKCAIIKADLKPTDVLPFLLN